MIEQLIGLAVGGWFGGLVVAAFVAATGRWVVSGRNGWRKGRG